MSSISIKKISITEQAWERAITACRDFLRENEGYEMEITFAVPDDGKKEMGEKVLNELR